MGLKTILAIAVANVAVIVYLTACFVVRSRDPTTRTFAKELGIVNPPDVLRHTLPDGRVISFKDSNPHGENTIFFIHGTPGSREFEHPNQQAILSDLNARLISVDRFGAGFSSWAKTDNALHEFPDAVKSLASSLKIDRFAVVGFGSGAPYALAVARALGPDTVTRVVLASGLTHLHDPIVLEPWTTQFLLEHRAFADTLIQNLVLRWPSLLVYYVKMLAHNQLLAVPDAALEFLRRNSGDESNIFTMAMEKMLARNVVEYYRNGTHGHADEILAQLKIGSRASSPVEWEQNVLAGIKQPIDVFHGGKDGLASVDLVKQAFSQSSSSVNVNLHIYDGAGHFGVFVDHWRGILQTATTRAQ
eukprot:GEZU01018153.1.p1 GENE.GEZU01018153.1~~GEZU01018153.1.p1  ORF type:complete len:407 (-),score=101.63 GEZU01018153.1:410-1489(-)